MHSAEIAIRENSARCAWSLAHFFEKALVNLVNRRIDMLMFNDSTGSFFPGKTLDGVNTRLGPYQSVRTL